MVDLIDLLPVRKWHVLTVEENTWQKNVSVNLRREEGQTYRQQITSSNWDIIYIYMSFIFIYMI